MLVVYDVTLQFGCLGPARSLDGTKMSSGPMRRRQHVKHLEGTRLRACVKYPASLEATVDV